MSPQSDPRANRAGSNPKLDEMAMTLKPLADLLPWRQKNRQADEIYGAIVARARLPIFYQGFGVPDSLEGRFVMLSLHLFAVLHRLKEAGTGEAAAMAQDLADRFTADMETVLRELGVGDLSVPKRVRSLVASGAAQLEGFERAFDEGEGSFEEAVVEALPGEEEDAKRTAAKLAPYVLGVVQHLKNEPVRDICAGTLRLSPI